MDYITRLELDYIRKAEIVKRFESAETEAEKSAIRAEYQNLTQDIKSRGEEYEHIFTLYYSAKERKNKHINISNLHEKRPAEIVEMLRKYGIEVFTFSSKWSGMVDDLAEFLKAGCEFCGIAEIFSDNKRFMSDEYETENAIVLYIKWG